MVVILSNGERQATGKTWQRAAGGWRLREGAPRRVCARRFKGHPLCVRPPNSGPQPVLPELTRLRYMSESKLSLNALTADSCHRIFAAEY